MIPLPLNKRSVAVAGLALVLGALSFPGLAEAGGGSARAPKRKVQRQAKKSPGPARANRSSLRSRRSLRRGRDSKKVLRRFKRSSRRTERERSKPSKKQVQRRRDQGRQRKEQGRRRQEQSGRSAKKRSTSRVERLPPPPYPPQFSGLGPFARKVLRFGSGDAEARARAKTLTAGELRESGFTLKMARTWLKFLKNEKKRNPDNPSVRGRIDFMRRAIVLLGGAHALPPKSRAARFRGRGEGGDRKAKEAADGAAQSP